MTLTRVQSWKYASLLRCLCKIAESATPKQARMQDETEHRWTQSSAAPLLLRKNTQQQTKLGIGNQFLPSSRQERSRSGEIDFLNCWGKGKGRKGKGERGKGKGKRSQVRETGRVGDGDLKTGKRLVLCKLQFCISNCLHSATLHLPFGEVNPWRCESEIFY